jgi:hypothetical protein
LALENVLFLAKVMPKFSGGADILILTCIDGCGGANSILLRSLCVAQGRATMVLAISESMVANYLESAKADMIRNNRTKIRCPCRRCKLDHWIDPSSRHLESHLLLRGFMDGYSQWRSDDDREDVSGDEHAGHDNEDLDEDAEVHDDHGDEDPGRDNGTSSG